MKLLERIIKSNIQDLANAELHIAELEHRLVADECVGYLVGENGRNVKKSVRKQINYQTGEKLGQWCYVGGTVGNIEYGFNVWVSDKGKYAIDVKNPKMSFLNGLTANDLVDIVERMRVLSGGNIVFQMSLW